MEQPTWAQICGFDYCVEWADNTQLPLNIQPVEGEIYKVRVRKKFVKDFDRPLWVLYLPCLSSINGWDTHPDEIALSCLVQVEMINLCEAIDFYSWIAVKAQRVIPFTEIYQTFRANYTGSSCWMLEQLLEQDSYNKTTWQEWTFISASMQSDVGAWIICQNLDSYPTLLIYGESDFEKQCFFAGCRPLTVDEWTLLNRQ